jgi:hypothetical protein
VVSESAPNRLRVGSRSALGGFRVSSGWFLDRLPNRLRVGSGSAPDDFRIGSESTPGRFRVSSGSVPGRLRVVSGSAPGGLQVESGQVGLHLAHVTAAQNEGDLILISEPKKNRARDHKTTYSYTNKYLTACLINASKGAPR